MTVICASASKTQMTKKWIRSIRGCDLSKNIQRSTSNGRRPMKNYQTYPSSRMKIRTLPVLVATALLSMLARSQGAEPLPPQALIGKLKWRCVGPYIGGRVVTVTGVPGNRNLFYAGTVGGGVWKSSDGAEWENITDGKLPGPSASIGAIAVAPSDPNGKTWQYAGLRETHSTSAILVAPKDPNVVYVASMGHVFAPDPNRGVFKSTDGGKSWKKILFVDNDTGAICLVMDPGNPGEMYATMWQAVRKPWGLSSGGPGSGIYKTTDGGTHWTNISRNPGLPQGVLGRIGVSIAASKPDIVYAIIQAKDGGVFRSDDAGATWKRVNQEMKLRQRAFYYMTIYVDPKDPNTAYAPEVDALWISHDGGKTFTKLRTPHGDNHVVWINPEDTKILLEGNDGGATVSADGGKTWTTEHNQPTGQFYHVNLDDQFPYHIYGAQQDEGSFEGPSAYAGGMIPFAAWHPAAYGESTYTVPQPGDTKITYGSGYYSIFLQYDAGTHQYRSVSPWPHYQEGLSSGELKYRFGWTRPILFSPANPKQLFTSAQCVFKSDDSGATWKQISPDLTRNERSTEAPSGGPIDLDQSGAEIYPLVSALAVSPLDGDLVWAGSDDGLAHVTTDGGKTWQKVTPPGLPQSWITVTTGLPQDEFVFDVRQDPDESNLLFLGTRSTMYCSLDAGAHWQPLTLNLPVTQVRDVAINTRQGQIVAATHGRSFWVLDNLTFLEQLTKKPAVQSNASFLFAPQKAWLTHDYGLPDPDERRPPDAGYNPPFGATVFFHVPQDYDGKTPATLSFIDAQGKMIRSFPLHLATEKEKKEKEQASAGQVGAHLEEAGPPVDHSEEPAEQQIREKEAKLAAIEPGMNVLQWDLRYPSATEVAGYHTPIAAGGLEDSVEGPVVVPGTYSVVLDYGGQKTQQNLEVALDPRLHATQEDLEARLALDLQIHADLDALNKGINQALAARDKLQQAVSNHGVTDAQGTGALAALNRDIDSTVPMAIKSSEGDLLYGTRLRDHLAYPDIAQAEGAAGAGAGR
ncbi:MAG: hypothetical protein DMF10_07355 [Verrucomicrobia bacterium]|nr:MAG: hypothetical protein DMF10_07355 [Verrucomicrobiota bacterium]